MIDWRTRTGSHRRAEQPTDDDTNDDGHSQLSLLAAWQLPRRQGLRLPPRPCTQRQSEGRTADDASSTGSSQPRPNGGWSGKLYDPRDRERQGQEGQRKGQEQRQGYHRQPSKSVRGLPGRSVQEEQLSFCTRAWQCGRAKGAREATRGYRQSAVSLGIPCSSQAAVLPMGQDRHMQARRQVPVFSRYRRSARAQGKGQAREAEVTRNVPR